ncbi:MAG: hypothetical protein B6244_00095 [Candidatus Cloacimonetes bacterium 4572_55]|nr:MAG: hypothetical protein B6244_00095 [Candidatus Cloacimonetes bacterium 4572_55]
MVEIIRVDPTGIAAELGIEPGDHITHINEQPIRDKLDFYYFIADDITELRLMDHRTLQPSYLEIEKDPEDDLGLTVAEMKVKTCGCNCIFCFVDQNPPGMRSALYFKDGDYRFSFLQGHFVTLNNVGKRSLRRIIDQRLSPLNVSIHTTDPDLRVQMTGHPKAGSVMEKIRSLTQAGIVIHAQIVLCPGVNDDNILIKSLEELAEFYPGLASLSIVPVGITKYQKHPLLSQRVDSKYAAEVLLQIERLRERFKKKFGSYLAFPSDEWYLTAGHDLPHTEAYENFPQYENGVGMCRSLLDDLKEIEPLLPSRLENPRKASIVTAELIAPTLEKNLLPVLNSIENFEAILLPTINRFYGKTITVSGRRPRERELGSCWRGMKPRTG